MGVIVNTKLALALLAAEDQKIQKYNRFRALTDKIFLHICKTALIDVAPFREEIYTLSASIVCNVFYMS